MRRPTRTREFFDLYTGDFSKSDFQRLFTHETPDAYEFFARHIDEAAFRELPVLKRVLVRTRLIFLAFTLKLSPARRVLFALALVMALVGLAEFFRGFGRFGLLFVGLPAPVWADGTMWLLAGFVLVNLLVLLV